MTDFDVERVLEFEIETLHMELGDVESQEEKLDVYERLVDALELRIQQLKDKQTEPTT